MDAIRWPGFFLALLLMSLVLPQVSWGAGERSRLETETLVHVEQALKHAAVSSPVWHSKQEAIQRDIQDISYVLDEAINASRAGNQRALRDYVREALGLLRRAIRLGHFRADDVAPVLALIQSVVPSASV
jgi:hypothetical protein